MACGTWHVLAMSLTGHVYSSGSNKNGELGRQTSQEGGFHQVTHMKEGKTEKEIGQVVGIGAGFGVSFFIIGEERALYSCGREHLSLQKDKTAMPKKVKAV